MELAKRRPRAIYDPTALLGPAREDLLHRAGFGAFELVLSLDLLSELRAAMRELTLPGPAIAEYLAALARICRLGDPVDLDPALRARWLTPGQRHPMLELALATRASFIVTDSLTDYPSVRVVGPTMVLSPAEFLLLPGLLTRTVGPIPR